MLAYLVVCLILAGMFTLISTLFAVGTKNGAPSDEGVLKGFAYMSLMVMVPVVVGLSLAIAHT